MTFTKLCTWVAHFVGKPSTFVLAFSSIVVWALLGPHFDYSDTWQLIVNTSTTIVTFLVVILLQNTQNRDIGAIHAKLDTLILHVQGTDHRLVDAERMSESEIEQALADLSAEK